MSRSTTALVLGLALLELGCGARAVRAPELDLRFLEVRDTAVEQRFAQRAPLSATLVSDAQLQFQKASDLLKAAETPEGGDPMKLLRAARTLAPGPGVVLFGTVRGNESTGGATTNASLFQLAIGCSGAGALDAPSDLTGCRGYLARATREWPAEVYDVVDVTITLIPEGGTVRGRLRLRSTETQFRAEVDGEFAATIVELRQPDTATAHATP